MHYHTYKYFVVYDAVLLLQNDYFILFFTATAVWSENHKRKVGHILSLLISIYTHIKAFAILNDLFAGQK